MGWLRQAFFPDWRPPAEESPAEGGDTVGRSFELIRIDRAILGSERPATSSPPKTRPLMARHASILRMRCDDRP